MAMSKDSENSLEEALLPEDAAAPAEPSAGADEAAANPAPEEDAASSEEPADEEAGEQGLSQPQGGDADEPEASEESPPAEEPPAEEPPSGETAVEDAEPEGQMDWYILKVQSNRENSISEALQRRVAVAGLEKYFGEIIVPTEMVTEFKGGKKRVVKRKLYPGYIVAQMIINDDTWFLVRETPGIGDFTGAGGKPTPMLPHEVKRIVTTDEEKTEKAPTLKIPYNLGDRVKINEGTFENFEGEVSGIDEASGRVTVMINIFGRSTPVELEYWQVESL